MVKLGLMWEKYLHGEARAKVGEQNWKILTSSQDYS